jgi:hypothetical protein
MPNGMPVNTVFAITFPNGFDLSGLSIGDVSMTVNGTATSTGASNGAGQWGVATGTHYVALTAPSDQPVASSSALVVTIGDEAGTMITNPSATSSYQIELGTDTATTSASVQDSGAVRVAILEEVTVSASVNTTLEFSVSGVGSGQSVNGTTTTDGSTITTIPFGTLTENEIKTLAQDLTVTTNAKNGVTVTAVTTGDLQSTTGAIIDGFVDGSYTSTPTAWAAPTAVASDPKTYGHWGLTTSDTNITGSNEWISPSTTPVTVFDASNPLNASTTRVGYQVEISALQEAGNDYSTTIRYIATPTF